MPDTGRALPDDESFDELDEDLQQDRFLTFRLGEADYALELRCVTEIVVIQKITVVPDLPAFVKGVINLRGQVIPVLDVRERFHLPPRPYDERTCVVVVNLSDVTAGLIVDRASEVLLIPAASVCPPPTIAPGRSIHYIRGLGKANDDVKIILDLDKLLFAEEVAQLTAVPAAVGEAAAG